MTLSIILLVVLIVALIGSMPQWRHSRNWGYLPSGGVGTVLLVLILVMILAHP
jgi:hypothetical protein